MDIETFDNFFSDCLIYIVERKSGVVVYPEDDKAEYIKNLRCIGNEEYYDTLTRRYYQRKYIYTKDGLDVYKYHDVTDYKQKIVELETDQTMNIPIKKRLYEDLKVYLQVYKNIPMPFSLALIDIDHFKQVNDKYGHLAGDRVLRDIATFLKNNIRHNVNPITGKPDRPIDGIYRFGGEEILLLLKNINAENTEKRLNQIRETQARKLYKLKEDSSLDDSSKITFSAGVVNFPKNVSLPNSDNELENFINNCIEAADAKLYEAKGTGRNNVKLEKIYRL